MSLDFALSKAGSGWSQTGPRPPTHHDAAAAAAPAQQLPVTAAAKKATAAAANKSRFAERHQQQCSRFPAPAAALRAVATQSLQPALLHREQQQTAGDVHQQLRQQLQELEQQQQHMGRGLPPKHQALAARMAAAAERQQHRQQQQQQQQQQGSAATIGRNGAWNSSVAADIRMLVQELRMPPSLAPPLAAAAAKGQITRNPGILMSQLLRLLPLEPQLSALLGGQPHALATLLASHPPLLRCDPASLRGNAAHVAALLGSPDAAAAAVRRYPQVLAVGPFRIAATLPVLQELLSYASTAAAGAVAARQPMLLLSSPDHLRARWAELQRLLPDVPEATLKQQLRRTPEVLLMRPSTLAGKLACLELIFAPRAATPAPATAAAQANAAAPAAAAAAAAAEPAAAQQQQEQQQQRVMRVYKQHELSYRLQRLQALTQAAGPDADSVAATAAAAPSSSSGSGSSSSGPVDPRLQRLVLKVPALLSLSPATLHSHVLELALLLGLQTDDPRLSRIVLLQPGLLTQAPTTLANKLVLLQHLSGRDEAAAIDTVLRVPAVLCLSCAALEAKWGLLARATAACPRWAEQLRTSQPASVGMLLCYSPARLQRLHYVVGLVEQQQQQSQDGAAPPATSTSSRHVRRRRAAKTATRSTNSSSSSGVADEGQALEAAASDQQQLNLQSIPWRSWVQESDAKFTQRFPGFRAWLAAASAEGAVEGRHQAAAA